MESNPLALHMLIPVSYILLGSAFTNYWALGHSHSAFLGIESYRALAQARMY